MSISHVVVLTGTLLALLAMACVLIRMVWFNRGDPGGSRGPHFRRRPTGVDRRTHPGDCADGAAHHRLHDDVADTGGCALSRDHVGRDIRRAWARGNRANRPALRRLDRSINQPRYADRPLAERRLPPVEQIAAELRRLHRQRRQGLSNESEKWSAAVTTAYDAWLLAACRRLDITEHLTTLAGMDLEIERMRVEGQLEIAGLVLR